MIIKSSKTVEIEQSNRTNKEKAAIEVMKQNEQYDGHPQVAMFWYDTAKDELFGIRSTLAEMAPWYYSHQWDQEIKTDPRRHDREWRRECSRGKDKRFRGDHTLVPRGRVFQFKDEGFQVYTGDWIDKYPHVKQDILFEFDLPEDTEFVKDPH